MTIARSLFTAPLRWIKSGAISQGIFWSWNLIFLVVTLFGLLPFILYDLLRELFAGTLPASLALSGALLVVVPLVCSGVGLLFRREPQRLIRLFYGIEAPLLIVTLFRLFLLRELNPGIGYLMLLISLCLVSYGYTLVFGSALRPGWRGWVQYIGHTAAAVACIHAGLILSFYVVPLGWVLLKELFSLGWLRELWDVLVHSRGWGLVFLPLAAVLLFYSATLFVAMPFMMVWLYGWNFVKAARAFAARSGPALAGALALGSGLGFAGMYVVLNEQPQKAVLQALRQPPHDDIGRRALLGRSAAIRAGLLNGYLAPYRYLSSTGSDDHIISLYEKTFALSREHGRPLQALHNLLARPLLYDGSGLRADRDEAERDYEAFFDTPLQKGERASIRSALQATYERNQREAGLLAVDERKVWLARQEVRISATGDLAEVELHEVYENQTVEQQEILYYFTLPESAAVTGLWLGESEAQRFRFAIAPRGAAQKVYTTQVRRRQDPALLEQVGPRQYRLRAFPIPPRPRTGDSMYSGAAPRLHLWLTYRVLAQDSTWPLPVLRERRNVYWTVNTERSYPGLSLPRTAATRLADVWLPAALPAQSPAAPLSHVAVLFGGFVVRATPVGSTPEKLPAGKPLAVVLDRSRSMAPYAQKVQDSLAWLRQYAGPHAPLDLYLTSAPSRGEAPSQVDLTQFDPTSVVYYGGHKAADLLQQFAALRAGRSYQAIVVLTDEGSLDLADDRDPVRDFGAPVFLVHLGGVLPPGYDDATLATIQKRGGAALTTLSPVFQQLATAAATGPGFAALDGGYLFTVESIAESASPSAAAKEDGFSAIAARQLIKFSMRQMDVAAAAQLDRLHELAQRYQVVTPYSSMIVLVDARQLESLRKAETEADRFTRRVETAGEPASPPDALVTATPEPAEWVLLALVGVGIWLAARRARVGP